MFIKRTITQHIIDSLTPQRALIIYGPRRCGKTTLLEHFISTLKDPFLFVTGEDVTVKEFLSSSSIEKLRQFIGDRKYLIIDEAQKISDIGINLKLMLDHIKDLKIIASGSSSFELSKHIGEPLTGRKLTFKLFPLAQMELQSYETPAETVARQEDRIVFGSYPEVALGSDRDKKAQYLRELVGSYLFKDILELDGLRHADKLLRIVQLLAFQIGKEVSMAEIGVQAGLSRNTVERYLDLLEKAFVVFRISGFSRNLRKEIFKTSRFFFYDNGIRNAVINNFNVLNMRDDKGMLWENYVVVERLKKMEYAGRKPNFYFWRTHDRKEIDWVEEVDGRLNGYEIKWASKQKKAPSAWTSAYPGAGFEIVTRDNYPSFIL